MSGYITKDIIVQGGSECLKVKMFEILDEDRRADMIQSENRVLPHQCFLYLQKKKKPKTIYHAMNIISIMFYFKKNEKDKTYGKQAHKVKEFVPCKYPTYPEGENDHN